MIKNNNKVYTLCNDWKRFRNSWETLTLPRYEVDNTIFMLQDVRELFNRNEVSIDVKNNISAVTQILQDSDIWTYF